MRLHSIFSRRRRLSGEIARIALRVDRMDSERYDHSLYGTLDNVRAELIAEIKSRTQDALGPNFELRDIEFEPGSIEIYAVVAVVGTVYVTLSQYKDLVESLGILVRQLRSVIKRFFERRAPQRIVVTGSWAPAPELLQIEEASQQSSEGPLLTVLVSYLLLSHAILIGVVVWLLFRFAPR